MLQAMRGYHRYEPMVYLELLFGVTGLIPTQRSARVMEEGISWNYTTWLNIGFLVLAVVLVVRFVRTGGLSMLRGMGGSPDAVAQRNHFHSGHSHQHGTESTPDSGHGAGPEHDGHQP